MSIDKDLAIVKTIAKEVDKLGGQTYYVGGYVRDMIMGKENKDVDIEIYNITINQLRDILDSLGERTEHGQSFGVFGLKDYESIDIAMPRTERCVGNKHTDFDVSVDPFITTKQGAIRRDLTMNAIMQNVLTSEIVDNFNGLSDIKNGVIKFVCPVTFKEDALRVLRVAQFNARFPEMRVDYDTLRLCSDMDLWNLPKERVYGELSKVFSKSSKPSIFFNVLRNMNQLKYWFSELSKLSDTKFEMVMDILDRFSKISDVSEDMKFKFMLSGLCIGMHYSGVYKDDINTFMQRFINNVSDVKYANAMVDMFTNISDLIYNIQSSLEAYHEIAYLIFIDKCKYKEDSLQIFEIMLPMLNNTNIPDTEFISNLYKYMNVYIERMAEPILTGDDLVCLGFKPGKIFTELLRTCHDLQLLGHDKPYITEYVTNKYIAYKY